MKKYFFLAIGLTVLFTSCNQDRGTISMTYNKATAIYGDIEEVRNVPLYAAARSIDNPGKIFIGNDFLLIGEEGAGIHVFDNSNPSSPAPVGFIQLPFTKEFYVENNFIYAESHYDFLKIDLTTITSPVMVDREENAFSQPITNSAGETLMGFNFNVVTESFKLNSDEARALEESRYLYYDYMNNMIPPSSVPSSFAGNGTEVKGTLNKITVANNHVYVIGEDKLYAFKDDAGALTYIGETYVQPGMETVYPENDRLFIGTESSMVVMNISSPSSPEHISTYAHPTSCDPVYPFGNVAYLTLRTGDFSGCSGDENTLDVIDISNINSPFDIASIPMTSPYGMTVVNNYLFVGEGVNGLTVFDVTNPQNPVESTSLSIEAYDIMPHPTDPTIILTAGHSGLEQYSIDYGSMSMTLISSIVY